MTKLPLDVRGLLIQRKQQIESPSWQPFWVKAEVEFSDPLHIALVASDGDSDAPWLASAACLAARLGRLKLANQLIDAWLSGTMPEVAANAKSLLREERWHARRLVAQRREWPKGIVHLEDVPSWMIPAYCKLRHRLFGGEEYRIISGGHLLDNRSQEWHVDYSGSARHVDEPPSFATATWT